MALTPADENLIARANQALGLSLDFEQRRSTYYESLQRVRFDGDWEQGLRFFTQGVGNVSGQAVETATKLLALVEPARARIRGELKSSAGSALRVLDALAQRPVTTAKRLAEASGVTARVGFPLGLVFHRSSQQFSFRCEARDT